MPKTRKPERRPLFDIGSLVHTEKSLTEASSYMEGRVVARWFEGKANSKSDRCIYIIKGYPGSLHRLDERELIASNEYIKKPAKPNA